MSTCVHQRQRHPVGHEHLTGIPGHEADNHLIELAVAAQANAIVTLNVRDIARGELKFPSLRVLTPEQCLEVFPCPR